MKKIVLIFGLIAGAIVSAMLFISMPLYDSGVLNFKNGEVVGYTTMVIALSMVFFGIRSYRDNYCNGIISFGKGLQAGLLITLVASLLYAISWEICYHTVASDFMQRYGDFYMQQLKEKGATESALKEASMQMENFKEKYSNPVIRFGYTLLEIAPVGIVISLVSALLLKKKGG